MIEQGEAEIRLDAIVKRFGDIEAVRGISLEIARSTFFTFLGPSGKGQEHAIAHHGGLRGAE